MSAWHEGLPAFTIANGCVVRCANTGAVQPETGLRATVWMPFNGPIKAIVYMPGGLILEPWAAHAVNRMLASNTAPS